MKRGYCEKCGRVHNEPGFCDIPEPESSPASPCSGRLDPSRRGVWFQSEKGFWFRKRHDAGIIFCVQVDGHRFFKSQNKPDQ